jgi:c-di-AMP phosphodiesterase-like protein
MGEKTLKSRIESYFNIGVNKKKESMRAYTEHIVKAVDKTMSYSVANHPLPLCLIDSDGMFLWFNKKFSDIYQDAEAANAGIYKITGLKPSDFFTEDLEKPIVVSHNGKTYRVVSDRKSVV